MKKKTFILAIDFDGTIAELTYPEIGELRKGADVVIRQLWEDGHKIVINTCRSGIHVAWVEMFLQKHKIPYHAINQNLPEIIEMYECDSRKVSADYYIDDKCLMGLPSWQEIYLIIKSKTYAQA